MIQSHPGFRSILTTCLVIAAILSLPGCSGAADPGGMGAQPAAVSTTEASIEPSPTPAMTSLPVEATETISFSGPFTVQFAPSVPQALADSIHLPEQFVVKDPAELVLDLRGPDEAGQDAAVWVYALTAPFMTVTDGVSLDELKQYWSGKAVDVFSDHPLILDGETLAIFRALWGKPGKNVQAVETAELLETAWQDKTSWAILPFESLEPRWKVLRIDDQSPLDKDFEAGDYPLSVHYSFHSNGGALPPQLSDLQAVSNRDAGRFTDVIMTGTTALARHTAFKMEENGLLYPGEKIRDWLRSADIAHVSNEIPFYSQCPPASPLRLEARFCSDPAYFKLFQDLGIDIVELTGNHVLDWGTAAFEETLDLYDQQALPYFGGGRNLEDARKPLLIEHNGNRLAFIGCNPMGPQNVLATADQAGAAPCQMEWFTHQISELKAQGYIPIVTFQDFEMENVKPHSSQRFNARAAVYAGAAIVSGSGAHQPQTFAFVGDQYIHYGLGNLFFDQMTKWNRPAFIDRHIFYDGRYISTEVLTVMLEDYAQPRPMTGPERQALLDSAFDAWEQNP